MAQDVVKMKLPFRVKVGYAIGQMGDSVGYGVFYTFFLVFLTDFVGLDPALSGIISLIAVLWDAVTDPIIGHVSDNLRCRYGRRRPVMLAGAIPYGICVWLMFTNFSFSSVMMKNVYFIIISVLFWTFYTMYVIPFYALGAELTQSPQERTLLRVYSSLLAVIAAYLSSALPPLLLEKLPLMTGMSENEAWSAIGAILGVATVVPILICWKATKGRELPPERYQKNAEKRENILRAYLEVLKLKPSIYLGLTTLFFTTVTSFISTMTVYVMTNNLGYSGTVQSTYFTIVLVINWGLTLCLGKIATKFDKTRYYAAAILFTAVSIILFGVTGIASFAALLVYSVCTKIGVGAFWTLSPSIMYDISELDEFLNDERREGAITSAISFLQKLGAAVGMWLTGMLLKFVGYDGTLAAQSPETLKGLMLLLTAVPGVIALLAGIFAWRYPLTFRRYQSLMKALERKKAGEAYSTEGLEKLF